MKLKLQLLLIALAIFAGINHVAGQGTAFTYQGRLNVSGQPANGIYNLTFALFDSSSAGNQVGVTLTNSATAVTNGLFTVTLDYGGAFNGASRWLQIGVQTNTEPFAILSPLQPITPTPYAIYSATAGNAATATTATTAGTAGSANSVSAANITGTVQLTQLPGTVLTNGESSVNITGSFNGNGGGLTNLQTASLTGTIADSLLSSNIARLNIPNTNIQATASPVITAGFITGTTNLFGGTGYTNSPSVTVTDVSGSNAVITATVANGVVTGLAVQNAGNNYSAGATLTIAPPPSSAYQTFNCANVFTSASNYFAGSFIGNGAGLTNVNLTGPSAISVLGNEANGYQALLNDTTGGNNTANGYDALFANTTGGANTATGWHALLDNTTGSFNQAYGYQALFSNTTGSYNNAFGLDALRDNTTGNYNIAIGDYTLEDNTTGSYNTANGYGALLSNTTGSSSTAVGYQALNQNTSGYFNTANGYQALLNNTSGKDCTAIGWEALAANTIGIDNTAVGTGALESNTNGNNNTAMGIYTLEYNTTGNQNTAYGEWALQNNTTGSFNTANGAGALIDNTTGSNNVANGYQSLYSNTNGSSSLANGYEALYSNTSGSNNIAEGYQAGYNITTGSSNIDIGNMGLATDTNIIRIGSGQAQTFIAGVITGNGSGLTSLPNNVALLNANQTFTGVNTFTNNVVFGTPPSFSRTVQVRPAANRVLGIFADLGNSGLSETSGMTIESVNDANSVNEPLEFRGNPSVFTTGNVAIGTTNTTEKFEVDGTDTTIRIRNLNDSIGGFIGNTYDSVRLGMYNDSTTQQGVIPAGAKQIFFGFNENGAVGSLTNTFTTGGYTTPFRNLLDDGSGNMRIAGVVTGNGSGLTNLNPTNLSAGTAAINISGTAATATTAANVTGNIADSQLSANVALLHGTNSFTGTNTFAGATIATNASNIFNGSFSGSGAGLTNLSANAISGGLTINFAVLVPGGGTNILCFTNGVLAAIQ